MMNKGILYKIFIIPLLVCILVCPFHIYADTKITTSNITGCHITDKWLSDGTAYNNITCDMDDNYYGYATMSIQYYVGSSSTPTSQAYYVTVSGNSFDAVIITSNQSINSQKPISVISVYDNYIYKVDDINDALMWDIPFESFGFVASCFNSNLENVGFNELNNYKYPIFQINENQILIDFYADPANEKYSDYRMIFFVDKNIYNISTLSNYFRLSDGEYTSIKVLNRFRYNGKMSYILDVSMGNFTSVGTKTITYINSNFAQIIPIYFNNLQYNLFSLEFAMQYGLTNSFIDDVHSIAQGTLSSATSSNELETVSDDISSSSDDLIRSENDFNNSMNNNLQQIDTNINIGNLGSKFLASADWVRMQFNTLTNGTPFGSVLSFSLLLGLALILVGRIRK